jgi:allantoate deiminase
MPSWAGHDAQIFAAGGVPTGMIFVPSINGISHAREERSDFQAVTQAVQVLEKTLKTLAEV